ncbi:orotate phosphoribosyltransferase [Helicobacter aurati]|uniref:Orotate phosphoribosyltransferase n=1 Tax=Helicobacter aurati TaxID=137778 RepID=A0A3D8J621_9HELI|nr:orotate phosphoribosyltransferase [Helicobacter aurati]RDU72957.1 orotate phosphoribosyltransferase [Helicobacter aurati]
MDIEKIYKEHNALLEGHFLLSSGNHTQYYLQSAKVLEYPQVGQKLALALANLIKQYNIEVECVCSPALGGILAGYELARALNVRFIFTERINKEMTLRRGFQVRKGEKVLICEDIITTGGSALESAQCILQQEAVVTAFAGLANRGFCEAILPNKQRQRNENEQDVITKDKQQVTCKLPLNLPLFALANFSFEIYPADSCPLCKSSVAYKPGSRN